MTNNPILRKRLPFGMNLYDYFIQRLKEKAEVGFPEGTVLHRHHIHPKHDGGKEQGEMVLCTVKNHARAHYIRYKVFGQTYDLCAYDGLVGRTNERLKLMQQRIIQTNKERGNVMFNPEWQKEMANRPKSRYYFIENPDFAREMASKGGSIGGKVMTEKKRETLKANGIRVGTFHGRKGGLKHQAPMTKVKLSQYIEWQHQSGVMTISPPFESVRELKEYLNNFVPESVPHSSGLSEILREVSHQRYGWSISKILDL